MRGGRVFIDGLKRVLGTLSFKFWCINLPREEGEGASEAKRLREGKYAGTNADGGGRLWESKISPLLI
jgi:hypothetical protein